MTVIHQAYETNFWNILKKSCHFTNRDISALWAIVSTIIGTHSFSLSGVSSAFGRKVGRNFLAKVLKKYSYVQRKIAKILIKMVLSKIPPGSKIYLIIDDTLVHKRGKKIFGSLQWYDHASRRRVQALGIVNVAVVVNDKVVFILPVLLLSTKKRASKGFKKQKEQGAKTLAAIEMLQEFLQWFEEIGIARGRTVVLADSWYGSQPMPDFYAIPRQNFESMAKRITASRWLTTEPLKRPGRKPGLKWRLLVEKR